MGHSLALFIPSLLILVGAGQSFAEDELTPHSIIDRALTAAGGTEKIGQLKAISFSADVVHEGKETRFTGLFAGPSLFRVKSGSKSNPSGKTLVVIAGGDTFWVKYGNEGFKEIYTGDEKAAFDVTVGLLYAVYLPDRLLALKGKDYTLKLLGEHAANGVEAIALRASHELHPEAVIYFDKGTGLPVKSQVKLPVPKSAIDNLLSQGGTEAVWVEVFFDGYTWVDGIKHFTKLKVRAGENTIRCERVESCSCARYAAFRAIGLGFAA